jgi:hypothetical protein
MEERTMRGRWPLGLAYLEQLAGSEQTKERLRVILETLVGDKRLQEACSQLELGETRFAQLREAALQGTLAAIEPRPAGRPSRATSEGDQVRALQARVEQLELELEIAQVREEIALVFPHLVQPEAPGPVGSEPDRGKKARRQRKRIRKAR